MHQSVTLQASLARDPGPPPFPHYLYFTNNPFMIIITIKVLLCEHPRREVHPVNRREPSISQGRTHHTVSTAQVQHTDGCDDGHDDDDDGDHSYYDDDHHQSPKANRTTSHPTLVIILRMMVVKVSYLWLLTLSKITPKALLWNMRFPPNYRGPK